MIVKFTPSALRETRWFEVVLRFAFGGLITAAAGMIARRYGPVIGGLFLAFPAIFPASATLVAKHEREEKERKGLRGERRGKEAAAADACGAAMGSVGLFCFAAMIWQFIPRYAPWMVLIGATLAWMAGSVLLWIARKRLM